MTPIDLTQLQSFNLDHHGIVAGIIDDIGLVDTINEEFGVQRTDSSGLQEAVSTGVAVKAMILNGQGRTRTASLELRVGFVSAPLYLFERFFEGKPTEHLLGEGVRPDPKSPSLDLSDDKLGKVLDKLYEADLTRLFVNIALSAATGYGVNLTNLHLDTSSFSVHGEYASEPSDEEEEGEGIIHITHGYSRERRPDLKQYKRTLRVLVDLMASSDEGVPSFFDAASGNESDKERFAGLIRRYRELVDVEALFIADSALYSEPNLQALSDLRWVTRVPLTLKDAKRALDDVPDPKSPSSDAFEDSSVAGYRIAEQSSDYAGVKQRWLIIESKVASEQTDAMFESNLRRQECHLRKELKTITKRAYHCREDAYAAAEGFSKALKLHRLSDLSVVEKKRYLKPGRPTPQTSFEVTYRLTADPKLQRSRSCLSLLARLTEAISTCRSRSHRFIIASNIPAESLSNDELLVEYKDQQVVERGFRFLRDPLSFTSSVFIKTPSRVAALAMIMALSLLVYTLGQRLIRRNLAEFEGNVPDQIRRIRV